MSRLNGGRRALGKGDGRKTRMIGETGKKAGKTKLEEKKQEEGQRRESKNQEDEDGDRAGRRNGLTRKIG